MSKRQLIEDIQHLNPTAAEPFLTQFDEPALKQYLDHLRAAAQRKIHINRFVRRKPQERMVS